ncbi:MAG: FG-GAP repeat protein [Planctomycetes bacterium]|nr:FG-GAP repeat protein [Planctomycetota bacterium]
MTITISKTSRRRSTQVVRHHPGRVWPAIGTIMVLALLFLSMSPRPTLAQQPAVAGVWIGEAASGTGHALANALDLDFDGRNDLIISSPYFSSGMNWNGTVRVFSSAGQNSIWQVFGLNPNERLGLDVASPGDLNGDLLNDYLITGYANPTTGEIFLRAYSGLDGSILYSLVGPPGMSGFAERGVTVIGDVDLDGTHDFAVRVVAPGIPNPLGGQRRVDVHSGSTGALLYSLWGSGGGFDFGYAMLGVDDLDGDLGAEFLVSDPYEAGGAGSITLYSGVSGAQILKVFGATTDDRLGWSLASLSDVDGDGYRDFAAGAMGHTSATVSQCGMIRAFSTLTGNQIFQRQGSEPQGSLGRVLQEAGDYDGDGKRDLVAVDGTSPLTMHVLSGANGIDIESIVVPFSFHFFSEPLGSRTAALGDMDGDGHDDFITASSGVPGPWAAYSGGSGTIQLYAGTGPVRRRVEFQGLQHGLGLHWIPDGANPQSVTGTLLCDLGFPGGQGVVITSTGYHDEELWGYLPLLVDLDPAFNPQVIYFDFNSGGLLNVPNLSRQDPALAGLRLQVQVIQYQPIVTSSNALEFLMTP